MAQKSSRKPKPQLESLHKSRNKGRARGAKIATKSLPLLTCSPSCSTDGYLSSCASADRDLSSSDPSLDHEPSASQGLLPPSQAMELVLKDIAKAVRTQLKAPLGSLFSSISCLLICSNNLFPIYRTVPAALLNTKRSAMGILLPWTR